MTASLELAESRLNQGTAVTVPGRAGTVLDVRSCFGFPPLLLAERPQHTVITSGLAQGTMRLPTAAARELGVRLDTLSCDAARVPLPDRSVDRSPSSTWWSAWIRRTSRLSYGRPCASSGAGP
ncbi:hypothetical protein [Streptomyces sp. HUAS ZL42]|uniref:hypothetical protein n=1 Tax=Streptomyces sp. HUAS ZL42 TaxID=3231715 RepID=UPI00345EE532